MLDFDDELLRRPTPAVCQVEKGKRRAGIIFAENDGRRNKHKGNRFEFDMLI